MHADFSYVETTRYRVTVSLALAVFFFLFMVVFLPFGVSNHNPNHRYTGEFLLAMGGIGVVTGLTSLINEFLLRPLLPAPKSLAAIVAWGAWLCVTIGLVNFFYYNFLGNWHDFHLSSAISFVANCSTVLVFPLVGAHFWFRHRGLLERFDEVLERERTEAAPERMLALEGAGAGDRIELRLGDFLYARSQDNYVELHYLVGAERRSHLLRATISGVADAAAGTGIIRCHRSYLVNLHRVVAATGNDSRLQLALDGAEEPVAVSRSYAEDTLRQLEARRV